MMSVLTVVRSLIGVDEASVIYVQGTSVVCASYMLKQCKVLMITMSLALVE